MTENLILTRPIYLFNNSPCNWVAQISFTNSRIDMVRNIFWNTDLVTVERQNGESDQKVVMNSLLQ